MEQVWGGEKGELNTILICLRGDLGFNLEGHRKTLYMWEGTL